MQKNRDISRYLRSYAGHIAGLLSSLDHAVLIRVINCFLGARQRSSAIFFVGNGGSAATASHFGQDLAEIGRKINIAGFKSISLTDNVPHITALANDYGYETVFTEQMREIFKPGDVLVAISASGNSPNVVNAVQYAKRMGGQTVAFVGFGGGKLARICDHVVHIKTKKGEYGPVEDMHTILNHIITKYLYSALLEEKSGRPTR